jgi:two-component system chemotaxis sensor kinase CheA
MKVNSDISPEELKVFLEEAEEQIELLDNAIVRMEKEADNAELMQEIFRAAHTIKGSSGMVGHVRMAELTHAMETMLDKIRNGQLKISSQIVNALLFGLDALKVLKEEVVSQEDADLDIAPIVERLKELTSAEAGAKAKDASTCNSLELNPLQIQAIKEDLVKEHNIYRIKANVPSDSVWAAVRFMQVLNELNRIGKVVASSPSAKEIEEEKVAFDLEVIFSGLADMDAVQGEIKSVAEIDQVKVVHITEDEIFGKEKAPMQQEGEKQSGAAEKIAPAGNAVSKTSVAAVQDSQTLQSVRIDVKVLDNLMNIVEELVIDRSRISRVGKVLTAKYEGDEIIQELSETSNHIIKIINELQENIMKVRMVPISTIFSRFPRLVRDLAQKQQKNLDFSVEGGETELDRSIIEQIRDPLLHLLRNAVDHGVEPPEVRRSAGKPETATVKLDARQEQGNIVITLQDDGKGIDTSKLKAVSIKRGLVTEENAAAMSEADAVNLIFIPGLSTAEKATEVSGRGVGMDIVRTNIENLGGSIAIETNLGKGTKFTIRLPLTVAIVQGLLISSGGATYIMPLGSVVETLTVAGADIKTINQREVIRLRDSIVPIMGLENVLGRQGSRVKLGEHNLIVVIKAGERLAGLVVDNLMERQEIVVKPLGSYLGDIEGISGATILGDGRVALILDAASLSKMMTRGTDGIHMKHAAALMPVAA